MDIRKFAFALGLTIAVAGCGGGGGGEGHPVSEAGVIQGSSEAASGSTAVYTEHGVTHVATPGDSIAGFGTVRLLMLPNTGSMAAHSDEVLRVIAATVTTSLSDVDVNGVALDPENDIGAAYSYDSGIVSLFKISTRQEIALYDTQTVNGIWYTGAIDTKMAGIVMEPSTKTMIITTADGIETVDYSTPSAPVKTREIASLEVDGANGVEVIENFAYDKNLVISGASHKMLITGGHNPDIMELVDTSTGKVYRPDAATRDL
jgi:WD40 repeat protein